MMSCPCIVYESNTRCSGSILTMYIQCECNIEFNCTGPDFFNDKCNPNITYNQHRYLFIKEIMEQINNGNFKEIFEQVTEQDKIFINTNNNITYQKNVNHN